MRVLLCVVCALVAVGCGESDPPPIANGYGSFVITKDTTVDVRGAAEGDCHGVGRRPTRWTCWIAGPKRLRCRNLTTRQMNAVLSQDAIRRCPVGKARRTQRH